MAKIDSSYYKGLMLNHVAYTGDSGLIGESH